MPIQESATGQPIFVDELELRAIVRALKRFGWVALVGALIGGAVGGVWSRLSPKLYRAEAVLLVNIQQLKIGADGVPMDVELVLPARQLVGAVCESDAAMEQLAERLADGGWQPDRSLAQRVTILKDDLYYDQRSLDMGVLRATTTDPGESALMVNTWAQVSRELLIKAYGTTDQDLQEARARIDQAKQDVLAAEQALADADPQAPDPQRIDLTTALAMTRHRLDELTDHWAMLSVRAEDSQGIARIVSRAATPVTPINASLFQVVGLFACAGLFVGLAVVLLLACFQRP